VAFETRNIEIEGLEEFMQAIKDTPEICVPLAMEAMDKSTLAVLGIVSVYPPETEANQPGRFSIKTHRPMGYYDRGVGWWYPVKRKSSLGENPMKTKGAQQLGKRKQARVGAAGYKLGKRSERLRARWAHEVKVEEDAIVGEIGNSASYQRYVNGMDQARIHAARGWKRIDMAIDEAMPDIEAAWQEMIDGWAQEVAKRTDGGSS
jgi:hypothetical protein